MVDDGSAGDGATRAPLRIVFSSDELPDGLNNRARLSLWRDLYAERFGACDAYCDPERPFMARSEIALFGDVGFAQFEGTIDRFVRTQQQVASDPAGDMFFLGFNRGRSGALIAHRSREVMFAPRGAVFMNGSEPTDTTGPALDPWAWLSVSLPRAQLLNVVPNAEDLVMSKFDIDAPAMRHLRRYLDILQELDAAASGSLLGERIGTIIFDLVALALGANGDSAEIARMRGLRAARTREILVEIDRYFTSADFTSGKIAQKLGLSRRYVNDLLAETGVNFTERVIELRLQKTLSMLADPRYDRLRVSEIAEAAGFNEVSYFNRCFRRRFGASPMQFRGRGGNGG
jgi:AraC-like DNA-binding protein